MKTQSDFYKNSTQKIGIINANATNLKYYQLPTFLPRNTFYKNNFLISKNKNKSNSRYYLNNNNKIIPIPKTKRNQSLSTTNKPQIKLSNNITSFHMTNNNFYNSSALIKKERERDGIERINNFNVNNINNINKGKYNKFSSRTVPKRGTLYKIKSTGNPVSYSQALKKFKIVYNENDLINDNSNINNVNNLNKNYNNLYNFNYDNSLEKILSEQYCMYQDAKHSSNSFDLIVSYGVNTYRGIFRNYNEDRVAIIVNAKNPKKNNILNENIRWPNISYFGIFDGHAGNKCSEYLKNNLHNCIFNCNSFPNSPIKSIEKGFKICENNYIKSIHNKTHNEYYDYSGSCAIIILIIDDMCYIANLGDSRALYSYDTGSKFFQLSRDHKPNDPKEKKRIYKAGGSIFKTSLSQYGLPFNFKESDLGLSIPFRILPGRLAVSIYLII
jgi:hypothetical protein